MKISYLIGFLTIIEWLLVILIFLLNMVVPPEEGRSSLLLFLFIPGIFEIVKMAGCFVWNWEEEV